MVAAKDWDLIEEAGQEQWLDVVEGLGAVKVRERERERELEEM